MMKQLMASVREQFDKSAWPTAAHEEWRRSDPQVIPFNVLDHDIYASEAQCYADAHKQIESQITALSSKHTIAFSSFSPDALKHTSAVPPHDLISRSMAHETDRVDAWRVTRLTAETAGIINVDANQIVEEPIRITLRGENAEAVYAPQIILVVGAGSSIHVSITLEGEGFFLPAVYCHGEDNAKIHYNIQQNTGADSIIISNAFFECGANALARSTSGQLGGMIAVDRVHGLALGQESLLLLNGYYYGVDDRLIDMRAYQHHEAQSAQSRALYNGVAKDESHTIFRGLINVGHNAENTDAYLSNKNLLLSEEARMDSIPCLNINTNEVKCSHGSTTGNLDPNHIFYLMSRGLSEDAAKHLLIEGFFESVFDDVFDIENARALEIIKSRINS